VTACDTGHLDETIFVEMGAFFFRFLIALISYASCLYRASFGSCASFLFSFFFFFFLWELFTVDRFWGLVFLAIFRHFLPRSRVLNVTVVVAVFFFF